MLLVQGRGEMAVLPAVTAVLLHHIAMDTWTDCNVLSTGGMVNGGSACSYCSTVSSHCLQTGIDCNILSTGGMVNGGSACSYCSTVSSQCYGYMD